MYAFKKQFDGVSVYIEDLLKIERIIRANVKLNSHYKDSFEICLYTRNRRWRGNSFEDFDNVKEVNDIIIYATGWEGKEITQSVKVVLSKGYCKISTNGVNEVWARGFQKTMEEFIGSKRTFLNKYASKIKVAISIMLGIFAGTFLKNLYISIHSTILMNITVNSIGLLLTALLIYWNFRLTIARFTTLSLKSKDGNKRPSLLLSDWIQIIGLIITLILGLIDKI